MSGWPHPRGCLVQSSGPAREGGGHFRSPPAHEGGLRTGGLRALSTPRGSPCSRNFSDETVYIHFRSRRRISRCVVTLRFSVLNLCPPAKLSGVLRSGEVSSLDPGARTWCEHTGASPRGDDCVVLHALPCKITWELKKNKRQTKNKQKKGHNTFPRLHLNTSNRTFWGWGPGKSIF